MNVTNYAKNHHKIARKNIANILRALQEMQHLLEFCMTCDASIISLCYWYYSLSNGKSTFNKNDKMHRREFISYRKKLKNLFLWIQRIYYWSVSTCLCLLVFCSERHHFPLNISFHVSICDSMQQINADDSNWLEMFRFLLILVLRLSRKLMINDERVSFNLDLCENKSYLWSIPK